jgi:hypothetical protein
MQLSDGHPKGDAGKVDGSGRQRPWVGVFALVVIAVALTSDFVLAQSGQYWLDRGKNLVVKCPGATDGEAFKVANAARQWGDIHGVLMCVDAGANYRYELQYFKFQINPEMRDAINRQQLSFEWVGLSLYKPAASGGSIDWLYEESLPIQGVLKKTDTKALAFGNLRFVVPKNVVDHATNFLFYVTSEGVLHSFALL